jgi:hypothetical protein
MFSLCSPTQRLVYACGAGTDIRLIGRDEECPRGFSDRYLRVYDEQTWPVFELSPADAPYAAEDADDFLVLCHGFGVASDICDSTHLTHDARSRMKFEQLVHEDRCDILASHGRALAFWHCRGGAGVRLDNTYASSEAV